MRAVTENKVLTTLPCLCGCTDWRADRLRRRVGEFYLRSLAGEKLATPPLDVMLRGCCRDISPTDDLTVISIGSDALTSWTT
jgi:hypothetical protein